MDTIETLYPRRFNWLNASVITLSPPLALLCGFFYIRSEGVALGDVLTFAFMYAATGMAICMGYHRYFAHRAFECARPVQFLLLVFGAAAFQNSVLSWSSDHRYHHRHTDTEADPYSIKKGFFWAHMGWIYYKPDRPRPYANVADLKKDALVQWQHRYYLWIAVIVGLALPIILGAFFGRPWGGLVWGGLLRGVAAHHSTFLINSAAHTFGRRPHDSSITARDSWWLPYLSFGEGYHNYHHAHPSDYRNGAAWHHWDPAKWIVATLSLPGWTWGLRRAQIPRSASRSDSFSSPSTASG